MLSLGGNGQFDWRTIGYASGSTLTGLTRTSGGVTSTNWGVAGGTALYSTDPSTTLAQFSTVDVPADTAILMQIIEAEVQFVSGTSGSGQRYAGVGVGVPGNGGVLPTLLSAQGVSAGIQYDYAAEEFQPDLIGTPLALNEWIHIRLFVSAERAITWINGVMVSSLAMLIDDGDIWPVKLTTGLLGVICDNNTGYSANPLFRNLRAFAVLMELPT